MSSPRINGSQTPVTNPVDKQSYPRINGRARSPDSRINGRAFTNKWSRTPYYLYLPVLKTCIRPSHSVENPSGFTHIRLAQQQET